MQIEKIGIFRIACFDHTNASFTSFTEKSFSKSSWLFYPNVEQIPLFELLHFGFCSISKMAQIFIFSQILLLFCGFHLLYAMYHLYTIRNYNYDTGLHSRSQYLYFESRNATQRFWNFRYFAILAENEDANGTYCAYTS